MLVGFMGAGKSTVGSALAARMGCAFEDLDQRIESRAGRTVAEIFNGSGEAYFRRLEREALLELLAEISSGDARIVALGGGAFAQKGNVRLIASRNIPTVFLDAPVEELWRRCHSQVEGEQTVRPLLQTSDAYQQLYQARRPHYLKATYRQRTDGKRIDQIVTEIIELLHLGRTK